jgi:hypothetical protein
MTFFVLKKDAAHPSMTYNYIATFLIDKLNILLIHADFETCRGHITVRMLSYPSGLESTARTISVCPLSVEQANDSSSIRTWTELVTRAIRNLIESVLEIMSSDRTDFPRTAMSRISSLHPIMCLQGTSAFFVSLSTGALLQGEKKKSFISTRRSKVRSIVFGLH